MRTEDHLVFWILPILSFILTAFMCGVAVLSRDKSNPNGVPIPLSMGILALIFVVFWHLFEYYNRTSLSGHRHIGYYTALMEYGNKPEWFFNFGLLVLKVIFFLCALLVVIGLLVPPEDGKS